MGEREEISFSLKEAKQERKHRSDVLKESMPADL
jgi:hypothetical protein